MWAKNRRRLVDNDGRDGNNLEMRLSILPYNFEHFETSYEFLMDIFTISFGSDRKLWPNDLENYSFEKYRAGIEKLLGDKTYFFFGVYHGQKLVGQIELKKISGDCGYVSLYYLKSEYRNQGYGKQLDEFALEEFKRQDCRLVRLTVGELNLPGQRFYEKNGWKSLGPDPKRPTSLTMEKVIN